MEFPSPILNGFSRNYPFQEKIKNGFFSSPSSSLVLDGEKGELVKAAMVARPGHHQNGVKAEKALIALRNHCEAERRRRERISTHLATLRSLIPGTSKLDKASLLAEVINHLKLLRSNATEAAKGILVPMDHDEVRVEQHVDQSDDAPCSIKASLCCDYNHEILSDLRQALDALQLQKTKAEFSTLGGRMIYVFIISCCKNNNKEDNERCQDLVSSVHHTMRSVLDKFYATEEISSRNSLSNKRRRVPFCDSSNSSSLGDFW